MRRIPTLLLIAAVAMAGIYLLTSERDYGVDVVLPSAANLVPGSQVQIGGATVGKVKRLAARDGRAIVGIKLDRRVAPLHAGTTVRISWKALLGERVVELQPGPADSPAIPDGGLLEGTVDRVEIDQVLAALDRPTRERLKSLIRRLDTTLDGNEDQLNETLRTAGPAMQGLGQVLQAIGDDGPAIRALVTRLSEMTSLLAGREQDVRAVIGQLTRFSGAGAAEQEKLREALRELPSTLDAANTTLGAVPSAVRAAVPLLDELRPATRRLPAVTENLSPLLQDLRPAVADLKPTLIDAQTLLQTTPALLDSAHGLLPGLETAVERVQPALSFLRPYTPEIVGWMSNWASAMSGYDSNGHYARAYIQGGAASLNVNPGVTPPGIRKNPYRKPGELEGQPWTDANGSALR